MHRLIAALAACLLLSACSSSTAGQARTSPSAGASENVAPGGTDAERRAQLAAASETLLSTPYVAKGAWDLQPFESPELTFTAQAMNAQYSYAVRGERVGGLREYYLGARGTLIRKGSRWVTADEADDFAHVAVLTSFVGKLLAASTHDRSVEWVGPEIGATGEATGLRFFVEAAQFADSSDPELRSLAASDGPKTYTMTAYLDAQGKPVKTIVQVQTVDQGLRITASYDWAAAVYLPRVP